MAPTIRVDDDVMNCLKDKAKELDMVLSSRNAVLRAALGLPPAEKPPQRAGKGRKASRPISRKPGERPPTRRR